MMESANTLFLRLAGPMQAWGTGSRFQLRRTDRYPGKSGVLGLILCAMGVRREDSREVLERLNTLRMGVRIDLPGQLAWDYHTAGAKIGIRSAGGKVKFTASTGLPETLLSRRQYLFDASFLVALHGEEALISECAAALDDPVWPIFLGRKCCIPGEPVFLAERDLDRSSNLREALQSRPWRPRLRWNDRGNLDAEGKNLVTVVLESDFANSSDDAPTGVRRTVYDVPRIYGYFSYGPRCIVEEQIAVEVGPPTIQPPPQRRRNWPNYRSQYWKDIRNERLEEDNHECVVCFKPASEVHHVTYERSPDQERLEDLRSLCKTCHDACTILEYSHDMTVHRIDPLDPEDERRVIEQLERNRREQRPGRRRKLLEEIRTRRDLFELAPAKKKE